MAPFVGNIVDDLKQKFSLFDDHVNHSNTHSRQATEVSRVKWTSKASCRGADTLHQEWDTEGVETLVHEVIDRAVVVDRLSQQ